MLDNSKVPFQIKFGLAVSQEMVKEVIETDKERERQKHKLLACYAEQ